VAGPSNKEEIMTADFMNGKIIAAKVVRSKFEPFKCTHSC
jgi:hypothetical protein